MSKRTLRRAAERNARKVERIEQLTAQTGLAAESEPAAALTQTPAAPAVARIISAAQFAANRTNAQLSSGPVSEAGKAISSRNHTGHGLTIDVAAAKPGTFQVLPGEDQAAFDESLALFTKEWKPATATEIDFIERLAIHRWLGLRATRLQDQLLIAGEGNLRPQDLRQFEILSRYQNMHQRAFNKAFADFIRLRNFQMRQRKDETLLTQRAEEAEIKKQIGFESQKRKAEEHAIKMETLRLKLEAQKQRNQRAIKLTKTVDTAQTAIA